MRYEHRIGAHLLAWLLAAVGSARADDQCGYDTSHIAGGYWSIVDGYVFHRAGEAWDALADDLAMQAACAQAPMCVETRFAEPDYGDSCPIDDRASTAASDEAAFAAAAAAVASLHGECFARFAYAAAVRARHDFVPVFEQRLGAADWQEALAAAIALRQLGERRAEIWRGALTHWYPPVAMLAQAALAGAGSDEVRSSALAFGESAGRVVSVAEDLSARWCQAQPASWRGSWYDNAPPLAETVAWEFRPLVQEQGWPVCRNVTTRYAYAGGVLLGTDAGEWGGAVYFFRAPELPRRLLDDNVHAMTVRGARAFVATGLAHGTHSSSTVYAIDLDARHEPRARVLAQMPEEIWQMNFRADGSAWMLEEHGLVFEVPADGAPPRALGCVKELAQRTPYVPQALRRREWMQDPFAK